jgi:hypothetical protein
MSIKRPEGGWRITRTPVHPGETLREEFMTPLGISINGAAARVTEAAGQQHPPLLRGVLKAEG